MFICSYGVCISIMYLFLLKPFLKPEAVCVCYVFSFPITMPVPPKEKKEEKRKREN